MSECAWTLRVLSGSVEFSKLHGCGNDYLFIDCWEYDLVERDVEAEVHDVHVRLAQLARDMSRRHRGVGSDGVICVGPPSKPCEADGVRARMVMVNLDGSESEMCGNGLRCAARFARDLGRLGDVQDGERVRFETGAGVLVVWFEGELVTVDMGRPRLEGSEIPCALKGAGEDGLLRGRVDDAEFVAVGMGNPHAIVVVKDADEYAVDRVGPRIETHDTFPNRTNVEFVHQIDECTFRQRTWERGCGETEACGTGACAVAVAMVLLGLAKPGRVWIQLNGGRLAVEFGGERDSPVFMSGEAVFVFRGVWSVDRGE